MSYPSSLDIREIGGGGPAAAAMAAMRANSKRSGRGMVPTASTGDLRSITEGADDAALSDRGAADSRKNTCRSDYRHPSRASMAQGFAPSEAGEEQAELAQPAPVVDDRTPEQRREDSAKEVFHKLRDDSELHKDDMLKALELCGYISPNRDWIDKIFAELTQFSTLAEEEFVQFVNGYAELQKQAIAEAFAKADDDGSGTVDRQELAVLLRDFGVEPMSHVLDEVLDEVDEDGGGTLDLGEFRNVMEILWARESFTKKEYDALLYVYKLFDRDQSGEISSKELVALMNYLGYSFDKEKAMEIVNEVDIDGSGQLNEREFLMCMRKVRDREVQSVSEAMRQQDKDGSGTLSTDEIPAFFKVLGYVLIDMEAIREAATEAGLFPDQDSDRPLGLSELWQLLGVYRAREGLSSGEAALIQEAFRRFEKDHCGDISALEIGKVLRFLGYSLPFEVQQAYVARVDVDESGVISLIELRKLIRMMREKDLSNFHEVWSKALEEDGEDWEDGMPTMSEASERNGSETISRLCGVSALKDDGVLDACGVGSDDAFLQEELLADGRLNFDGFIRASMRLSKLARDTYRRNGGFSATEVEEMKLCFRRYDADSSGDISNKELIKLIEEVFPEMAHDRDMRPRLLEIMQEVDADGNGKLDFQDFLRLMKQCRELQDQERCAKENLAVSETGFSAQEVADFRDLFLMHDDGSGELSIKSVTKMLSQITPLGDKYKAELAEIFAEVTTRQCRVEGRRDRADFPEFLWLMKQLLIRNFANLVEKTKTVL